MIRNWFVRLFVTITLVFPSSALEAEKKLSSNESNTQPVCRFVHNFVEDWHECYGFYESEAGYRYLGEWAHNEPDGWGIEAFDGYGDFYLGQFKNGEEHGFGLQGSKFGRGIIYLGNFKNGLRNGWFTIYEPSGAKLTGWYNNDKRDGIWVKLTAEGSEHWYEYNRGRQIFPPTVFTTPEKMEH